MNSLIILSITGITLLFAGLGKSKWVLFTIGIAGLITAGILTLADWGKNEALFNKMIIIDDYSTAFNFSIIFTTLMIFLISSNYIRNANKYLAEIYALMIFALIGGCIMTSFGNMVTLFMGIETLSIPLYVLAGSRKTSIASNEASFKYFILGSFATAFFLLGVALIYGASGTFNTNEISSYILLHQTQIPKIFYTGIIILIIGLCFKIAAIPFHFWSPDVYEGAPTLVTTFMATVVKTAGFAAIFRLLQNAFSNLSVYWQTILWIITLLTLLISALAALNQTGMKRLMAYSGISNSGFILLAVLAMNSMSPGAILFYTFTYALGTIIVFGMIMLHQEYTGSDSILSFEGFGRANPVSGIIFTLALLSLTGIPVTGGFFAKYYIFLTAIHSNFIWIVVIGVITTVISIYYYFKIINALWKENRCQKKIPLIIPFRTAFLICSILIILTGIFPDYLIRLL
ncbi:MAG: NADH-quinone oxidoreductase subunit N [Bacteroidota bacterium]|nr:NADH-quinone oxidoreductase subunit N [Bacteroidota bacterium]